METLDYIANWEKPIKKPIQLPSIATVWWWATITFSFISFIYAFFLY